MAGTLGDGSACTIRALIWALGRESLVLEKPEALKSKWKKSFLELKLIGAYEQLEKILHFIDAFEKANVDCTSFDATVPWKNGVYMRVFTNGVLEVMRSFSKDLMDIEKSLLLDPTGISVESLATAQQMQDTYQIINKIIQQICEGKLGGCQVLDVCYKFSLRCQITTVEKIRILVRCLHKQMMKQVKSWVLYGELSDPCFEFFIKQTCFQVESSLAEFETSISSDFNASLIESTSTSLPFTFESDRIADDIDKCFEIDPVNLPSHLPFSLVSKIFSVGKFMIQMKHNPSNKTPVCFMTVNLRDYGIDESKVRAMFKELEDSSTFHHHMFENAIDFIWCEMNKYMKRVAEEEGDLYTHHRNITDVYLMGRGELFRHFVDKASHLLLNQASKVHSRSLDLALERVAQDLYRTDDVTFLKRFQFTLPPKADTPSGRPVITLMKLVYKCPWPLHLIYSQDVLDTYNTVFIFLLKLKRAHRMLTNAWNDINVITSELLKKGLNELHFRLTALITSIQSYIFVDVILSETDKLRQIVQDSDSFDEILKAHAKFLSNIVMQLFLPIDSKFSDKMVPESQTSRVELKKNTGAVHKEIVSVFQIIYEFSTAVRVFGFETLGSEGKMKDLMTKFTCLIVRFISLVKKMNEKYCSEYLRTLVMRLDYNDYYINQYEI